MKSHPLLVRTLIFILLLCILLPLTACTQPNEPENSTVSESTPDTDPDVPTSEPKDTKKEPEDTEKEPEKTMLNNLFDPYKLQMGWVNASGATSPDGAFRTTSMIKVKEGDTVLFGAAVTTQGWHMVTYNSSKKPIAEETIHTRLTILERLHDDTAIMKYIVPKNVSYIRLICDARYITEYLITVNQSFNADDFFEYFKKEDPNKPSVEADPDSPLYGLKVLFCGDSISYGQYDVPPGYSWAGRIQKYYGTISTNVSVGGWCLSTVRGTQGQIVNQLLSVKNKEFDMIVVQGGVNDAWGTADGTNIIAPVGEMTDSFDAKDFDTSTYAGGLENFFYQARKYFPNAQLAYIISFYMPRAGVGRVGDMEEYYAVGMKICDKWGVPYLDMYHDDYLNYQLLEINTNKCLTDPVHPNVLGYDRLAPYIGDWLESIVE